VVQDVLLASQHKDAQSSVVELNKFTNQCQEAPAYLNAVVLGLELDERLVLFKRLQHADNAYCRKRILVQLDLLQALIPLQQLCNLHRPSVSERVLRQIQCLKTPAINESLAHEPEALAVHSYIDEGQLLQKGIADDVVVDSHEVKVVQVDVVDD
jgi:hypothetical protein